MNGLFVKSTASEEPPLLPWRFAQGNGRRDHGRHSGDGSCTSVKIHTQSCLIFLALGNGRRKKEAGCRTVTNRRIHTHTHTHTFTSTRIRTHLAPSESDAKLLKLKGFFSRLIAALLSAEPATYGHES
jgi:hypothetical protein